MKKTIKIPAKVNKEPAQTISPTKVIKKTVRYYNFVIFVIVVAVGLVAGVVVLTNIFINPRVIQDTTLNTAPTYDQNTITRVNQLETSDKNVSYQTIQGGRISPFSE